MRFYTEWTPEMDDILTQGVSLRDNQEELAAFLNVSPDTLRRRTSYLGLVFKHGPARDESILSRIMLLIETGKAITSEMIAQEMARTKWAVLKHLSTLTKDGLLKRTRRARRTTYATTKKWTDSYIGDE